MHAETAPEPMRQLAANLRRQMRGRGLLPGDLASRAEIDLAQLAPILRGERSVRLDTLLKLAGALDIPPEELLAGIRWLPDGDGGGEFRSSG
jgi:transcriptional regulator with XRE-family HTH domain